MSSAADGRVVLITGTRTGIGRYLAEHYLQQGARVAGCSRGACDLKWETYRHFCADVAREAEVRKMFAAIRRLLIGLEEVAHAVDFFLAEQSGAITGQTLYLGGP